MIFRKTAMVFLLSAGIAAAQNIPFGGIKHDTSQPVEITADGLNVDQSARTAEFTGGVVAGQGTMRLTADRVVVEYGGDNGGTGDIQIMRAFGNVTMTNGEESAEAQEAVYTVVEAKMRLTGQVLLTQGDNAISGEVLNIDLDAGTAQFEGRVTSVFAPAEPQ